MPYKMQLVHMSMHRVAVFVLCISIAVTNADQIEIASDKGGARDQDQPRSENKNGGLAPYGSFQAEGSVQTRRELGLYVQNVVTGLANGFNFVGRLASMTCRAIYRFSAYVTAKGANTALVQKSTRILNIFRNKTARNNSYAYAREVVVSIYSKAPHVLNSTTTFLDTTAQFSLEVSTTYLTRLPQFLHRRPLHSLKPATRMLHAPLNTPGHKSAPATTP
jgi:hypothetical protein